MSEITLAAIFKRYIPLLNAGIRKDVRQQTVQEAIRRIEAAQWDIAMAEEGEMNRCLAILRAMLEE